MNNPKLLVLALATASSVTPVTLMAQQPATPPQPESQTTTSSVAMPVPSTANSPEVTNVQLRPVTGELVSKLDSKSAKTGDSVVLKITEKATTADGIVIPKGSKLIGRVIEAEAKGKSGDNSRVTLQFDQAEIKGGQSLPIRSVIQSISPPSGDSGSGGDSSMPMASGPGAGGGAGTGTSGASSTGNRGTSSTASTTSSPSTASDGTTASSGAPAVGTVVGHNGNVDIRTTAVPGVLIACNSNGQPFSNASGALLGAKQNIHLDGGTQMVIAIATATPRADQSGK